ncbi:MAG: ubiquinone biosynthesis protein [Lachnospiraceae bacterium]|nr:ubiquinone biosynthesis protein [Lachnospiraceae bacterium]
MMRLKKLACLSMIACSLCCGLVGCGNDKNGSTSGNNDSNITNDTANNVGDAAGDLVEGAGNAVEDVADGVGNAVDDLVGMDGFDNYDDAHSYFLETMGNYHSDAKFEIRDEDRNLSDYQEGSKGYRFHLYDTSKNSEGELFGEFYVDANTGMIYQLDDNNEYIEYRGMETTKNSANNKNNDTNKNNSKDKNNDHTDNKKAGTNKTK